MATAVIQAFEIAVQRRPSNVELVASFHRFNDWCRRFEAPSSETECTSLQHRLSKLPGVQRELFATLSTLSFLLEQLSCSGHEFGTPNLRNHIDKEDPQVALVRQSVDSLHDLSSRADEIDAETAYFEAQPRDIIPTDCDYDIAYVTSEYPNCKAKDWLLRRLGQAINDRRYWLRRRAFETEYKQHTHAASIIFPDFPEVSRPQENSEEDADVGESTARSIPLLKAVRAADGYVECPCCQKRLYFGSENAWRRHFLSDLRPYICTSSDCSMRMFASKKSWLEHEMEHRLEWQCPLCHASSGSYEDYIDHIDGEHGDIEDEAQQQVLLETSPKPQEYIRSGDCLLCDWAESNVPTKAMLEHLATHLEQLAIYAYTTRYETPAERSQVATALDSKDCAVSNRPSLALTFLTSAIAAAISSGATMLATHRSRLIKRDSLLPASTSKEQWGGTAQTSSSYWAQGHMTGTPTSYAALRKLPIRPIIEDDEWRGNPPDDFHARITANRYCSPGEPGPTVRTSTPTSSQTPSVRGTGSRYQYKGDEIGGADPKPPVPAAGNWSCLFGFLGCREKFDDIYEWDAHCQSHFRGSLPKTVACSFKCEWTVSGTSGEEAWQKRWVHIWTSHRPGGDLDTDQRPDQCLIDHLWRIGAISSAHKKELRTNGFLSDDSYAEFVNNTRDRWRERRPGEGRRGAGRAPR